MQYRFKMSVYTILDKNASQHSRPIMCRIYSNLFSTHITFQALLGSATILPLCGRSLNRPFAPSNSTKAVGAPELLFNCSTAAVKGTAM